MRFAAYLLSIQLSIVSLGQHKFSSGQLFEIQEQVYSTDFSAEQVDSIAQMLLQAQENAEVYQQTIFDIHLAGIYSTIPDKLDLAKTYYQHAYEAIEIIPDSLYSYKSYLMRHYGSLLAQLGKRDSGMWGVTEALNYVGPEDYKQKFDIYMILSQLALETLGDTKMMKEFVDKMVDQLPHLKDNPEVEMQALALTGKYFFNVSQYDSAEYYFEKTVSIAEGNEGHVYVNMLSLAYSFLANIHFDEGDYKDALIYDLLSLQLELESGNPYNLMASYSNLGEDYWRVGQEDSAMYFWQLGIDLAEEHQTPDRKIELLGNLHSAYAAKGEMKKAYELAIERSEIYDTLIRYRSKQRYDNLYREFNVSQQEQEIKQRENELQLTKLQNTVIIIATVIVLLIVVFIAVLVIQRKEHKSRELKRLGQFKDSMTGMIAHDLKNPLGIILNNKSNDASTQQKAQQMLQLVNNMLDVNKFEQAEIKLTIETINLFNVVVASVEQVRPLLAEKNIQVTIQIPDEFSVRADAELITRVVTNLLTNAIKFSPNNSTVLIVGDSHGDQATISITDQGEGIPIEYQKRIFDSYEQVQARAIAGVGSTGLGLTFCKLAVDAHGSEMKVQSEIGKGSTFSFDLPSAISMEANKSLPEPEILPLNSKELEQLQPVIAQLKSMKLHQAFEMEELLEPFKAESAAMKAWTEAVLNAAYAGNRQRWDELLG